MDEPDAQRKTRRLVLVLVVALAASAVGVGLLARSGGSQRVTAVPPASGVPTATASDPPGFVGNGLEVYVPPGTTASVVQRVADVLSARLHGVKGATIARQGSRVFVHVPETIDPQGLVNLVLDPGIFEIRPVLGIPTSTVTPTFIDDPAQPAVLAEADGETFSLGPAILTSTAVQNTDLVVNPSDGAWSIVVTFTRQAGPVWTHFTGQLACASGAQRQLAIVMDGQVSDAPTVNSVVTCGVGIPGGTTEINGDFTQAQAQQLATVLTSGQLPVRLGVGVMKQRPPPAIPGGP
ncbi:MAG TPA: hypothetical protein VFW71_15385 [Actinomycetota bacterium]|nr:hypothetical protein [Actinomycetota bacterium]